MHPGLAPRLAAAAIIADIVAQGHALDEQFGVDAADGPLATLELRDRALARSIVTVALRRQGTIRKALQRLLDRGLPKRSGQLQWHLIVAAAQILFLDVPDHAAVDLGVHAARAAQETIPFTKLVNAVLRNIVRQRDQILAASDPLDDDTPPWLAARWRATFGEPAARLIAAAHRQEPTLDLTVISDAAAWAARLDGIVLPTGSVRLRGHTPVRELDGYVEGGWWVQDAAAAMAAGVVRAQPGERILDLCAAPGGKTAMLAAAGACVVAVDRSAQRLDRLAANLDRLGQKAEIVAADALTYRGGPFDTVLLDAPCSATGTIRRHPDVAWTKRETDIAALAALQTRLLDQAVTLIRPGGRLVYCTCSLEPEEGDAQVAALLQRHPTIVRDPIRAAEIGGLAECLTADGDLRTLPFHLPADESRLAGLDGFFAARLVIHG